MSASQPPALGPSPEELKLRFAILQRVSILFTVPDNLLRALARQLHPAFATAGSVVVKQGDPGDALFIVEEGRCEVTVQESPGHNVTIAFLTAGDFFGEMALVSEERRSASIKAMTDCRLLILDRQTLYQTLPPDSDAFLDLQRLVEQRKLTMQKLVERARLVSPEQAAVTVAVYSPKGGSGRTTVAINLAACLARQHPAEVLLVDLALPFNHAALMSNLVPTSSLALASQDTTHFEESLLSSILHHPGGMMLLPGVLRPEEADLINPEVIGRTMGILLSTFKYVIFDLPVALNENVLTILDNTQRIVLLATPELSTLKDITDLQRLFTNVLHIVPDRILVTMNHKSARPVVSRDDVERTLDQKVVCEFMYDGTKQDEAAVKGEILVLSDPKSAIARGTVRLAALLGLKEESKLRRSRFPFRVG